MLYRHENTKKTNLFIYLFIYLASPGFLVGIPQQREPITAVP